VDGTRDTGGEPGQGEEVGVGRGSRTSREQAAPAVVREAQVLTATARVLAPVPATTLTLAVLRAAYRPQEPQNRALPHAQPGARWSVAWVASALLGVPFASSWDVYSSDERTMPLVDRAGVVRQPGGLYGTVYHGGTDDPLELPMWDASPVCWGLCAPPPAAVRQLAPFLRHGFWL